MTIGFGQGIAVAPLQLAMGYATLFDGGIYHPPTILKIGAGHPLPPGRRVFTADTSYRMRSLLRLVVMKGTGKKADAPGYRIGGKTGTAQKLINGHYSQTINLTSFAGVFPMDDPRYVIVVMLDEPKATPETYGFTTAGWNVAPVVSRTVSRIAPMLGVAPEMNREPNMSEVLPFVQEAQARREEGLIGVKLREIAEVDSDSEVTGFAIDHRKVARGSIFGAFKGAVFNGEDFIGKAVERGAVAVVARPEAEVERVPHLADPEPRRLFAALAAEFYAPYPNTVVAVTGTNGKTSTVEMTRQIWRMSGHRSASIGTLGVTTSDDQVQTGLTTPDIVTFLNNMAGLERMGISHVAYEASSHGLDQHRCEGVPLAAAAFTNFSRDHLDYHETMESYFETKMRLFEELLEPGKPAVIWTDDPKSEEVIERCDAPRPPDA